MRLSQNPQNKWLHLAAAGALKGTGFYCAGFSRWAEKYMQQKKLVSKKSTKNSSPGL